MKVIRRVAEIFTVEMTASEIDCLVENFFDVDRTGVLLDGEELGNLRDHVEYSLNELTRLCN